MAKDFDQIGSKYFIAKLLVSAGILYTTNGGFLSGVINKLLMQPDKI
jgi:hypothetical protein